MAALVPGLAKAQPGDGPITIGVHYLLTGPSSELGLGFQYGARLALSEINAHGGVNGRELKLILVDDKSTPDGAITAVQRLTAGSTVVLQWGGSSSSPTIAVLPWLKAGPTPYNAGFASGPRVLEPFGRYVFSGASAPSRPWSRVWLVSLRTSCRAPTPCGSAAPNSSATPAGRWPTGRRGSPRRIPAPRPGSPTSIRCAPTPTPT